MWSMTSTDTDAVNRFDPTAPAPKRSRGQRLLAAVLLVAGAGVIAYGLTLDWLTFSVETTLGFGADLPASEDTVWDAIPESGYLLAAGAVFALLAAVAAVVAARASTSERAAGLTDLLASIAGISVGAGLAITYLRWSELTSEFDLAFGLPIEFNFEAGPGIWVAVAGGVLVGGGLTLHLARDKTVKATVDESQIAYASAMNESD